MSTQRKLPQAIIVGGGSNALSIARSLGERGVDVYALNDPRSLVRHSRHCTWIETAPGFDWQTSAAELLLGPELAHLQGAVLLAASDAGLVMLTRDRTRLQERFILDLSNPDAQLKMLDKLATYEIAREAEVEAPLFWNVRSWADVIEVRHELVFPLLVKPRLSHEFEAKFAKKFFVANDMFELQASFETAVDSRVDVLLMELIPGPDSLLCSYYTYLDEDGRPLFDFTKRVIRRYPVGMGTGCLHVTANIPEVRERSLALFRQAGLRGVANAEFKEDPRTGTLKLIECNARFTAANCLVRKAGLDLAYFVYARAVGLTLPPMDAFRTGLTLWDPLGDFYAFRALNRAGELELGDWLAGILKLHTMPQFYWSDPAPSLIGLSREVGRVMRFRRSPPKPAGRPKNGAAGAIVRMAHDSAVRAAASDVGLGRPALAADVTSELGQ